MGSPLVEQAVAVVQQAIDLDNRHAYAEAVQRYDEALAIFARARDQLAVNDPVSAVTIASKMEEYTSRAKVLRDAIAQSPFHTPQPAPLGLSMVAPIPVGAGGPPAAPVPAPLSAPQQPALLYNPYAGGYQEMPRPVPGNVGGIPAPYQYPPGFINQPQIGAPLAVLAAPPMGLGQPVAAAAAAAGGKITKTKEQSFTGHKNQIKFSVSLPRYAERLRPGENVALDVLVDNPTGCTVAAIKIHLMRVVMTVRSDGHVQTESKKVKGDEYIQGGRFPMKEEKYEGVIEFVVPSDATPSVSASNNSLDSYAVSYDLIVKAAVKWHDDVELVFPIIVVPRL